MVEKNRTQTGKIRKRMKSLSKLIEKRERSVSRLMEELDDGVYEDEYTRSIFRQTIKENAHMLEELRKEHFQLDADLNRVEITNEFRQDIKAIAAQISDRLSSATFEGKRTILDNLDVKDVFRVDDDTRWLEASCGLTINPIELHPY